MILRSFLGEDDYEGHITGIGRLPDPSHFDKPVRVDALNRGGKYIEIRVNMVKRGKPLTIKQSGLTK